MLYSGKTYQLPHHAIDKVAILVIKDASLDMSVMFKVSIYLVTIRSHLFSYSNDFCFLNIQILQHFR